MACPLTSVGKENEGRFPWCTCSQVITLHKQQPGASCTQRKTVTFQARLVRRAPCLIQHARQRLRPAVRFREQEVHGNLCSVVGHNVARLQGSAYQ